MKAKWLYLIIFFFILFLSGVGYAFMPDLKELIASHHQISYDDKDADTIIQSLETQTSKLNADEQFRLATAYTSKKEYAKAIATYENLLEKNVSVVIATKIYLNLGNIYLEQNNTDKTEEMYLKAVDISKDQLDISTDAKKAAAYFISEFPTDENAETGINLLMELGEVEKNNPEIDYRMGKLVHYLGDLEYANNFLKSAIAKDPQYSAAYIELGDVWTDAKNYSVAIDYYKKAQNVDTNNWKVYYGLGKANELLKKRTEAIDNYNKAIVLDSSNIESRIGLSRIYLDMNNKKAAAEQLYVAIHLLPQDSSYRKELNTLYESLIPTVYIAK